MQQLATSHGCAKLLKYAMLARWKSSPEFCKLSGIYFERKSPPPPSLSSSSDSAYICSGVTRVGDTRGGNWGCHHSIFSWKKTGDLFLVITVSAISAVSPPFIFSRKTDDIFAHHCHFLLIHTGVTPLRVSPAPFLPVRLRFSTILCKFAHIHFFLQVSLPWRVSPGAVRP